MIQQENDPVNAHLHPNEQKLYNAGLALAPPPGALRRQTVRGPIGCPVLEIRLLGTQ